MLSGWEGALKTRPALALHAVAALGGMLFLVGPAIAGSNEGPQVAFKVTSVHFPKEVERDLQGGVTPLEATERWQEALASHSGFRVFGFDEQVVASDFGGALLSASATVNRVDLFWTAVPRRKGGHVAAIASLTATFMDPATGEVFHQSFQEVSSPSSFLEMYDEKTRIRLKDIGKYYHTVLDRDRATFAKREYRKLVLGGLEALARKVARRYEPAVEEGKVLSQGRSLNGEEFVEVGLGFKNGVVRGGVLRLYHPREPERPVALVVVRDLSAGRARCRFIEKRFARNVRKGFIVRAVGVNRRIRPREGTLILQVTGFGRTEPRLHDSRFRVDEDAFSMWLTDDLGTGGNFFMLAPLPSLSAVEDTFEFAEGVEVAEQDIFGKRRIADVGVKGNFFKASILRSVGGEQGTHLAQELELRVGLEFYDLFTGTVLFSSETKRTLELEDEVYDRQGKVIVDVSEAAGFRKLARSILRQAARDAKARFRSESMTGEVTKVRGDMLTLRFPEPLPGLAGVLTVWRPVKVGFPERIGIAVAETGAGKKVRARFMSAKGVRGGGQRGDEVRLRLPSGVGRGQGPVVQADGVDFAPGLDKRFQVTELRLLEMMHVALGAAHGVQSLPPAYRSSAVEQDAELFREGDFDLQQAEEMLKAKVRAVDYRLRVGIELASLQLRRNKSLEKPLFQLKVRVSLVDAKTGQVIFEKAASGKREPKNRKSATKIVDGKVVRGLRAQDLPQQFEFLCKDLLDALVPYVIKKGLIASG